MSGEKDVRIKDAEIMTGDGTLLVKFTKSIDDSKKHFVMAITADGLFNIAQEFGALSPPDDKTLPGVYIVTTDSIFDEGDEVPGMDGASEGGDEDVDMKAMIENRKGEVEDTGLAPDVGKEGV